MGGNEQFSELHDAYVWEVNAAVGEGRLDLVWQLADEYLDQALELMTGGEPTGSAGGLRRLPEASPSTLHLPPAQVASPRATLTRAEMPALL